MNIVPMTQEELDALKVRRIEQLKVRSWWQLSAVEVARAYAAGMRDFSRADLTSADLRSADLRRADLRSADLRRADLRSADLTSADLRRADLRSADLTSADLRRADLRRADLTSAKLRSADLSSANLSSANLTSADLRSADLRRADLTSADLTSADLRRADLTSAKLRRADLSSADLSSANLPDTVFVAQVWLPGMSARNDYLCAYADEGEGSLRIIAGCFNGTVAEFKRQVTDEKGKDALYLDALKPIVKAFKLWQARQPEPAKETTDASAS